VEKEDNLRNKTKKGKEEWDLFRYLENIESGPFSTIYNPRFWKTSLINHVNGKFIIFLLYKFGEIHITKYYQMQYLIFF